MATPKKEKTEAAEAPAEPKRSKKLFIIIGAVVFLLLAGGGGTAYWMFVAQAAEAPAEEEKPPVKTAVLPLDPFVVNLADGGGSRYLRVSLSLVVEQPEDEGGGGGHGGGGGDEDAVEKMRLRSTILELLATQTSSHLVTPEGKSELKKAIAEHAAHAAHHLKITDVLFSEFIVQ